MHLSEINELHYITHVDNVVSILKHGILCHKTAGKYKHTSVADSDVQARREMKSVPRGLPLHQYVNLYLNARNPMLYRNRHEHGVNSVCVLQVSKDVLNLPDVVVTDGNAASNPTKFSPSPDGLANIDSSLVFAEYWTDSDPILASRKKWAICAEVLVPSVVRPSFIKGIYVALSRVSTKLKADGLTIRAEVKPAMFFL